MLQNEIQVEQNEQTPMVFVLALEWTVLAAEESLNGLIPVVD